MPLASVTLPVRGPAQGTRSVRARSLPGAVCTGVGWPRVSDTRPFLYAGLAFSAAGTTWTEALCRADSDGDGATNGQA